MNMTAAPPTSLRAGDYVMNFPVERPGDRDTARQAMKRNGCRAIRFELLEPHTEGVAGTLIAHGYVARMAGALVEDL
jgi:hypothetical protein